MLTGYTTATFAATEQLAFRAGVAHAASVAVSAVAITAVSDSANTSGDAASRRRLRRRRRRLLNDVDHGGHLRDSHVLVVDYAVAVADANESAGVMSILADDAVVAASLNEAGLANLVQLSTSTIFHRPISIAHRPTSHLPGVAPGTPTGNDDGSEGESLHWKHHDLHEPSMPPVEADDGGEEQGGRDELGGGRLALGAMIGVAFAVAVITGLSVYLTVRRCCLAAMPPPNAPPPGLSPPAERECSVKEVTVTVDVVEITCDEFSESRSGDGRAVVLRNVDLPPVTA